jgi:hypothetical protein
MSSATRPRVLVTLGDPPVPSWHDAVVLALQRESVDVDVQRPGAPTSPDPDIVVDLGDAAARMRLDPPLGVWRYGFGDGAPVADGAAGTIARLYRTTPNPAAAVVLHEGWFKGASRESAGTGSVGDRVARWCARVVRQILARDLDALHAVAVPVDGCNEAAPLAGPGAAMRVVDALRRWRRREQWAIGVVHCSLRDILDRGVMPEPRWVAAPRDGFFADPFPLSADAQGVRVLAEQYHRRLGRGSIVSLSLTRDGAVVDSGEWLAPPHHASYPFILRDGAHAFCVPEIAAANAVRAYPVAGAGAGFTTLLDGFPAVDPTLVRHDGRWWLFCTHRDQENQTELHLFHASDWRGPWQPHLLNPVKSDARSSRPAGAAFLVDGALYRPAQDCSRRYGGAIALNRVLELTPTRFREERALSLRPAPSWPFPDGLHTLNGIGDVVIVDGLSRTLNPELRTEN